MDPHSPKHVRYNKIVYSLSSAAKKRRAKDVPRTGGQSKGQWCVTEKVHGANLSVYISRSGHIRCAKRTKFLDEDDVFFGYHDVVVRLREAFISAADDIFEGNADIHTVIFYGELFGGSFGSVSPPHGHIRAVQMGVLYAPSLQFMLFDICTCTTEQDVYISFQETIELAEKHNIFYAKPLLIGSLSEAVSYDPLFASTIPHRLGLPEPDVALNTAEGIVVRSLDQIYVCGAEIEREIFKIKNAEFEEGDGCPPGDSADVKAVVDWILSLVNENKIAAAISKVGSAFDRSNWTSIVDEVTMDICSEAEGVVEADRWEVIRPQIRLLAFNALARQRGEEDGRK